jgi:hypothetical protein
VADPHLSTPAAIVIAGGFIAVAVFFGLRERGPGGAAPSAPAPPTPPAPTLTAPTPERPVARPAEAPVVPGRDVVAAQVAAALAAQKPALLEKCWKPSATSVPPPNPARWTFDFVIGADGRQLSRGVREERRTGSPEITRCVLAALETVVVPPPGASVAVDVPFALP